MNCNHSKLSYHKHSRKNYPFGRKSKPVFYGVKRVTAHCKKCGEIIK